VRVLPPGYSCHVFSVWHIIKSKAHRVVRRRGSHYLQTMAVRLSASRVGHPSPPGRFLVLISVRDWVDPTAIVRLEGLGQLKIKWLEIILFYVYVININSKGSGRTDHGLTAVVIRHLPGDTAEKDEGGQSWQPVSRSGLEPSTRRVNPLGKVSVHKETKLAWLRELLWKFVSSFVMKQN
jgi:hypothetical protein